MLQLLILLLLQPHGSSLPERNFQLRDRAQTAPTPVTDKDLRPMKAPDCKTEADVQRTLEQISHGEAGDCFIRDRRAFSKR